MKFCPTWAELFWSGSKISFLVGYHLEEKFSKTVDFDVRNSKYIERTFLHRVAEPTAHVNGRDERASPAVDKFARLRYVAIKGQQQKVLPPLLIKLTITALTGNRHILYNNAVEILSTHT